MGTKDTDGHFIDITGCENTKHKNPRMVATQYSKELVIYPCDT
jgi:hypothetical protein